MKAPLITLAASAVLLGAFASPASATDCWLAPSYQLHFLRRTALLEGPVDRSRTDAAGEDDMLRYPRRELAGGLNYGFNDPSGQSTLNADVAFGFGRRMRGLFAIGTCDPKLDTGRELVFGAAFGGQLGEFREGRAGIVGQIAINRYGVGDGTVLEIPVILGAGLNLSERTTLYGGPMLHYESYSLDGAGYSESESQTNPGLVVGVQSALRERFGINASVTLLRLGSSSPGCVGEEYCYEESSESLLTTSLRFTYLLGPRRSQ
jgi:hypothetical protein